MLKDYINDKLNKAYDFLNGKKLVIMLGIILFMIVLMLIRSLFGTTSDDTEETTQNTSSYKPAETIISGDDVDEEDYEEEENLINTFVDYCNNGQPEEAYSLISQDCKDALYPTLEDFENNYYSSVFETTRVCNLQSWINKSKYTTYRVRLIDDIMSTGDYDSSSNYQDYMTIVTDDDGNKWINISNYIIKEKYSNKYEETDELKITVNYAEVYVDYVEYNFSVKNKTDKTILLDTLEDTSDTMYLTTNSGYKRSCYPEGLSLISLKIDKNNTDTVKVKYSKSAGTNEGVDTITFANIVKNYEEYTEDKENYTDIVNLEIEF